MTSAISSTHPDSMGLFGGTFDPVHFGHLRPALELRQSLGLDVVRLLPCHLPAHRPQPGANTAQRIRMLELAIDGVEGLEVDAREALRDTWSYTVDTLRSFREEFPTVRLLFFLGMDAFDNFTSWHQWESILTLAHLVVIDRPDAQLSGEEEYLLMSRQRSGPDDLTDLAGGILRYSVSQSDISATRIRAILATEGDIRYLVPESVRHYINSENLYR